MKIRFLLGREKCEVNRLTAGGVQVILQQEVVPGLQDGTLKEVSIGFHQMSESLKLYWLGPIPSVSNLIVAAGVCAWAKAAKQKLR